MVPNIFRRFVGWISGRSIENPAVPMGQAIDMLLDAFGAAPNAAGETVNGRTALRLMAVYACVRVIAETGGSLPVGVFRLRSDGTREPDPNNSIEELLQNPNAPQTGQVWREQAIKAHLLYGNTYSRVIRNRETGEILELWPLHPDHTRAFLKDRRLWYETTDQAGQSIQLFPEEVLHVPLLPEPTGIVGEAPPFSGSQAIGLGLAADKHVATFFAEGGLGPMGVEVEKKWNDQTFNQFRKDLHEARKARRGLLLVSGGGKIKELRQDLAAFLEIRRYQVLEACRLYGVPPFMVGESEKGAPKSSVSEQERDFANHTLRPLLRRHEAEFNRKLFRAGSGRIVKFHIEELLQADVKTTHWAYSIGRQMGWYNVNEIRRKLGEPPIGPAGDQYLSPVNLDRIPRALEEILGGEIATAAAELEGDERRSLLEVADDGLENLGDRAERFFADRLERISAGLLDAGERFARSRLIPLGIPFHAEQYGEYCRGVARDHGRRAVESLQSDPVGWIAGGRLRYDPSAAMAAIIGVNGHASNQPESAPVGATSN